MQARTAVDAQTRHRLHGREQLPRRYTNDKRLDSKNENAGERWNGRRDIVIDPTGSRQLESFADANGAQFGNECLR